MIKPLLSFVIATLIVLSGLTVPKIVSAQNLNNSYQPTLGNINSNSRNDIFGNTSTIDPADVWDMNPLWVLPLFLIPVAYWYLYKRTKEEEEDKTLGYGSGYSASRYQAYHHDLRQDYTPDNEYNEQLEDITSWYSKKETEKPISNAPKLVP